MRGRREEDERKNKGNKTNILITKELSEGLYLFFVKFVVFYKKKIQARDRLCGEKDKGKKRTREKTGEKSGKDWGKLGKTR